ncbi:MAG: CRISPR-associated endonuclease Cas1 [Deltaproteobacteria bacterium]|nr:CRISPR-associated endonuclease Cas1 [Deltaproteobacteria bacterium]
MSVVYVTEQGAMVTISGGCVAVRRGDALLREVRLHELRQLVLLGHVGLSGKAVRVLLKESVDTVFLTRGGSYVGRLAAGLAGDVARRVEQHRRFGDPAFAVPVARACITAKLANQRRLLLRAQRRLHDEAVARALTQLRAAQEAASRCEDVDLLRGIEGRAAALYFGVFGRLLTAPGMAFTVRRRRPPPDAVNVLLSFGYTVLANALTGLCELASLDPGLGVLHAVARGRPSLALDLMEEFRPLLVDTAVVAAVNRRELGPGHFMRVGEEDEAPEEDAWAQEEARGEGDEGSRRKVAPDGAEEGCPSQVIFRREGVLTWASALERRFREETWYAPRGERMTYRQVLREQVYRLVRAIEGGEVYEGFEGVQ